MYYPSESPEEYSSAETQDLEDLEDILVTSIQKELDTLTPLPIQCCIYKVPILLRKVNEQAYVPQIISIGPYHHGEKSLKKMEEHKLRYLHNLLSDNSDLTLEDYIRFMRNLEGEARECYAEIKNLEGDKFVKMMLLDSAFIVEFLRKLGDTEKRDKADPIFNTKWLITAIRRDMLLLENQLPFFIVKKLYNLTFKLGSENRSLKKSSLFVFDKMEQIIRKDDPVSKVEEPKHLLSLLHSCFISSLKIANDESNGSSKGYCFRFVKKLQEFIVNCVKILHKVWVKLKMVMIWVCFLRKDHSILPIQREVKFEFPQCVTKLHEAGVKFKVANTDSLLKITFDEGVLEIPRLKIEGPTECYFRNLIAYEQCESAYPIYITDYSILMDSLINSPQDVDILCHYGVIDNKLGDNEAVSTLFNNLCYGVTWSSEDFCYKSVCEKLNKHSKTSWNKRKANLKHNYFNTPWKTISFFAGVALLILTLLQTINSFLSL